VLFFKVLAGFGRSLNRFYENRNHDIFSNGELTVLKKLAKLQPSTIIDDGVNIGEYSLITHKTIPTVSIYFEPVLSTYKKLKEDISKAAKIHPFGKGLFSETCCKEINIYPSSTHSLLVDIQGLAYESREK